MCPDNHSSLSSKGTALFTWSTDIQWFLVAEMDQQLTKTMEKRWLVTPKNLNNKCAK